MISIYKLENPENFYILEKYPKLKNIWENVTLQNRALKSIIDWNPKEKTGEIFLIKKDFEIIGVTGWFVDNNILDTVRMRWHGIIPEERGKGYSEKALDLLCSHIRKTVPKQYKYISESYTKDSEFSYKIRKHFEKVGFVEEFYDPTYGTHGVGETISIRRFL